MFTLPSVACWVGQHAPQQWQKLSWLPIEWEAIYLFFLETLTWAATVFSYFPVTLCHFKTMYSCILKNDPEVKTEKGFSKHVQWLLSWNKAWYKYLVQCTAETAQPGYSSSFSQSPLASNKILTDSSVIKCERRAAVALEVLLVNLCDLKEYNSNVPIKLQVICLSSRKKKIVLLTQYHKYSCDSHNQNPDVLTPS